MTFGHVGHLEILQVQYFADFAAGTGLCEPRSADFVAGAILCEPRSFDFVAGAVLCERRRADFVAGAGLCELGSADLMAGAVLSEPRSADFVAGTALLNLELQISWQTQHFVNLEVQISDACSDDCALRCVLPTSVIAFPTSRPLCSSDSCFSADVARVHPAILLPVVVTPIAI